MKEPSNSRALTLQLSIRYAAVLGSFWAVYCSLYAYATVYLLDRGFSSAAVGLIIAIGNIAGFLLQPLFAGLADRSDTITIHRLIIILSFAIAGMSFLLFLLPVPAYVSALVFILADAGMWILMALTNALSFYYINRGITVEFGIPRGTGSIVFSIISSILGILVVSHGTQITQLFTTVLMILLALSVWSMPQFPDVPVITGEPPAEPASSEGGGVFSFFRRYPAFTVVLIGFTLSFFFHNMANNNMIYLVKHLGGDEGNLGTLMSIQAIVELPAMFGITLLLRRFSSATLMKCAAVFFVVKSLAYTLSSSIPVLFCAQIFQGVSFALFAPASVYYVNEIMGGNDKVKGQAYMNMANTLGAVLGSLFGGVLYQYAGLYPMMYTGLGIAALGAVLVLRFTRPA